MQLFVNRGKAKGKTIQVIGPRFLIGRSAECHLRPLSDEVALRHAELKVVAGIPVIEDLGSEGGTKVNGHTLNSLSSLRNGDLIEIGPLSFTALMEERRVKRDVRKKSARVRRKAHTEAEIASWLIDEKDEDDDEDPIEVMVTQKHGPSRGADKDAFDLLQTMMTEAD